MIKKVDFGPVHQEVFGNPAPLGLLGLAVACAALTPVAFGHLGTDPKTMAAAFITPAIFAILFGGGCQLIAGLMDFANRNTFGGTIFTAFAFNWFVTGLSFLATGFGLPIDHATMLAVEILLMVVFVFLTYGFGFFSKMLFYFLFVIDLLYVCRILRGLTGSLAFNMPIGILTVALGLIGLWIALAGLMNPMTGKEMFWIGGPMFFGQKRKGFDWTIRRQTFEILYKHWKEFAFEEMMLDDLVSKLKAQVPINIRVSLTREKVLPDLWYLIEYGSVNATMTPDNPTALKSLRLTSGGIDLYEQIVLRKYTF
ncbi:MAG: GPR1/FUN34/YaaH family transporter [Candidatus Ozemobacteraceae bacterium]